MSIAYNCSYKEQFTFVRHAGEILHTYLIRDYWMELVYKSSAPAMCQTLFLSFSSFLLFILVFFQRSSTVWECYLYHTPYLSTQQPPQGSFYLHSPDFPMSQVCEISKASAGFSHAISRYSRVISSGKLPFLSIFVFLPEFWPSGIWLLPVQTCSLWQPREMGWEVGERFKKKGDVCIPMAGSS